jgi:tRNA (guanine9-N1)-methyltransferase
MFCHASNKKAVNPCDIVLSGVTNELRADMESMNASNWAMNIASETYLELFPKEKLVYLTADSDETLEAFSRDDIYIIGGLVDHNRLKLATWSKASEQGIRTARLPIDRYVELHSSQVLTINHMIDLVLEVWKENSWREGLERALPKRKILGFVGETPEQEDSNVAPAAVQEDS